METTKMNNVVVLNTRMNEYRLTRSRLYSEPTCVGHKDLTARDGHYITAMSAREAVIKMDKMYPQDEMDFTVQPGEKETSNDQKLDKSFARVRHDHVGPEHDDLRIVRNIRDGNRQKRLRTDHDVEHRTVFFSLGSIPNGT